MVDFLGQFEITTFKVKNAIDTFWETLYILGYFLYQHLVTLDGRLLAVRPDLSKFRHIPQSTKSWAIFEVLLTILANFAPTLANFVCRWTNFR